MVRPPKRRLLDQRKAPRRCMNKITYQLFNSKDLFGTGPEYLGLGYWGRSGYAGGCSPRLPPR